MAAGWNVYLSGVTGDGLTIETGYRPTLAIDLESDPSNRAAFLFSSARQTFLCYVFADDVTHQAIQSRADVVRIFPIVSVTLAQAIANFSSPLTSIFTGAQLTAVKAAIEAKGYDVAWTSASTTAKQLIRFLQNVHVLGEWVHGDNNSNLKSFLAANLATTVGSLSAAVRNSASTWMTNHGLSTAWITGTTTVRQVLRYIVQNYDSNFPRVITGMEDV